MQPKLVPQFQARSSKQYSSICQQLIAQKINDHIKNLLGVERCCQEDNEISQEALANEETELRKTIN